MFNLIYNNTKHETFKNGPFETHEAEMILNGD